MNNKNIIGILICIIILTACSGTKEALVGKKRSDSSDEFLIQKKNPLALPPDFDELPVPVNQENIQTNNNSNDIQELLKDSQNNTQNTNNGTLSIEKSILEKINN